MSLDFVHQPYMRWTWWWIILRSKYWSTAELEAWKVNLIVGVYPLFTHSQTMIVHFFVTGPTYEFFTVHCRAQISIYWNTCSKKISSHQKKIPNFSVLGCLFFWGGYTVQKNPRHPHVGARVEGVNLKQISENEIVKILAPALEKYGISETKIHGVLREFPRRCHGFFFFKK